MNNSKYYKLAEDDSSFFIVCGLNHAKTGKATYINFAVGNVIAVDDSKFGGSAQKYAPNMANVDMFCKSHMQYVITHGNRFMCTDVYKVTRKCNGESFCLEVPLDKVMCSHLLSQNAFY